MSSYYREPAENATGARQRLEATVRDRIVKLTAAGAHVCRNGAQDHELRSQLDLLRSLNPEFAARARALAGLPAQRPKPTPAPRRTTEPARRTQTVRYAAADLDGYQHTSDPQAYGTVPTLRR